METKKKKRVHFKIRSSKLAIIFVSLPNFLQKCVNSGLASASVTTIEKYFKLTSFELSAILGVYEISKSAMLGVLFFVGNRLFKTRCIAYGTLLMAAGYFMFALPEFFGDEHRDRINNTDADCHTVTSSNKHLRYFLSIGMALAGIGSSFTYSCGMSYIDENVSKSTSALYNGIFHKMGAIGIVIGVLTGGSLLLIYVSPGVKNGLSPSSPCWVGAWWLGYVIFALLFALSAIPLFALPRVLKEKPDQEKLNGMDENLFNNSNSFVTNSRVLLNHQLLINSLSAAMARAFMEITRTFLVMYCEIQFELSTFVGSLTYAFINFLPGILSHLFSGIFLFKYKLGVRSTIKYNIACCFFATAFACGFLFPLRNSAHSIGIKATFDEFEVHCDMKCKCAWMKMNETKYYNETCEIFHDFKENGINKCTCENATFVLSKDEVEDVMSLELIAFCISCSVSIFFMLLTFVPSKQICFRVVEDSQRISSSCVHMLISTLLGSVVGRMLVGKILDESCQIWTLDIDTPVCHFYDKTKMAWYVTVMLVAEGLISIILNFALLITFVHKAVDESDNYKVTSV